MFGSIAGALIGGHFADKAAKRDANATRYANELSARGYTDARPYITSMYEGGQGALNDSLATGPYTGETYATMDPRSTEGLNYISGFARNAMGDGRQFMGQGGAFGSNYQNIYNRAAAPSLDNAVAYATSSPQAQSLINAAMLDDRRQLEEQTLPGINTAASMSNNSFSSRAGVADAIANRAYDDRRARVAAGVYNDLTSQYLNSNTQDQRNMLAANDGLRNTYGIGFGMGPEIGSMLTNAGSAFRNENQAVLDDQMNNFTRQRDFPLNQYMRFNAGILNNAPQSATYAPVTANRDTARLGGAMAGFGFGSKYLSDLFSSQNNAPYVPPYAYGAAGGRNYGVNNNIYGF